MLDFEFNETRKEIWEAKKLLYEGDSGTKKAFTISLSALVNKKIKKYFFL